MVRFRRIGWMAAFVVAGAIAGCGGGDGYRSAPSTVVNRKRADART